VIKSPDYLNTSLLLYEPLLKTTLLGETTSLQRLLYFVCWFTVHCISTCL